MNSKRFAFAGAALATFLVLAAPAPAEAQNESAPALDEETARLILEDLGSEDFNDRESASESLATLPLSPEEIVAAMPQDLDLSPEQWERLDAALSKRFRESPRAGLGVSMAAGGEGIRLNTVMDQFPASDVLEPNDLVVAVDGRSVIGSGTLVFQSTILSHDPGETMQMTIIRGAEEMTLRVPLGSFSQLNQARAQSPSSTVLDEAWRIRRGRLGLTPPEPETIKVEAASDVWPADQWRDRQLTGPMVLAGGQAFSSPQNFWGNVRVAALLKDAPKQIRARVQIGDNVQRLNAQPDAERRRTLLVRKAQMYMAQIRMTEQRLRADDITREERIKRLAEKRAYQRELDLVQLQLARMGEEGGD